MLRAADEIYFVPEGTPLSTQLVKFQRNKRKSVWWSMNTAIFRGWSPSKIFLKRLSATSPPPCHPPAEEVTPLNDGTVIIDGSANVREINKAFNWHLPEDEARTVNGIILEALEEIPVRAPRAH